MSPQPALRRPQLEEEGADSVEVPATVVCARCGRPDCLGCEPLEENTLPSGVVAIVPWERPGAGAWSRLWSTARTVTRSSQQFFSALPSGDSGAAVMFAVVCEVAAMASSALLIAAVLTAIAPGLAARLVTSAQWQTVLARLILVSVPGFAAVMVAAHVALGLAMSRAAGRLGGKSRRAQALRFGLYSTGWDLMTSPLGLLYTLLTEGPRAALALLPLSIDVASRASLAFARGVLQLDDARARRARRYGTAVALAFTFGSVALLLLVLGLIVVL